MIATLMLGAWQAGWYGSSSTPLFIWPFALMAGGVLQSIAAIASFRARDGVAVAQLVYTSTGVPGVRGVSLSIRGEPVVVNLPNGAAVTGLFTRGDFVSVAPER